MTRALMLSAIWSASLAAGCGGGKSKPGSTTKPSNVAWKDMTKTQKKEYMEHVVLPTMAPMFKKFDPEKYAQMNCETCHGDSAIDGSFEMPNPKIFVLPKAEAGWAKLAQDKPKWLEFMGKQVKPQMAKLLSLSEFDPKTNPTGFGCAACHTMADSPEQTPPTERDPDQPPPGAVGLR